MLPTSVPTALLGGMSPQAFMRRHWQKKPLLVRGAHAAPAPITRAELFALAARDEVASRVVSHDGTRWDLRHGPFTGRALPPVSTPGWTLLVQGVDLQSDALHALLRQFRFVPDARLDDVMISWASDGGGVGPHVDSYDVFLMQLQGVRRWRVGPCTDRTLRPGLPLKILRTFEPTDEWILQPGDMLYLPPGWAHDGIADGECMTASIGFRAANRIEIVQQVVQRLLDAMPEDDADAPLYRDPQQPAVDDPARIPAPLSAWARDAVRHAFNDQGAFDEALGVWLSEPAAAAVFEPDDDRTLPGEGGVRLDRRSRMLYDDTRIYLNGDAWHAAGRDATLMRRLADERRLDAAALKRASEGARELLESWVQAGWLQGE